MRDHSGMPIEAGWGQGPQHKGDIITDRQHTSGESSGHGETPEQINGAIDSMRSQLTATATRPTVATLRQIVDGIRNCEPLAETAGTLGLDDLAVLDLAAKLGVWTGRVHRIVNVPVVTASNSKDMFGTRERSHGVVIPLGYEYGNGHRRNVSKALAALIVSDPKDDELARFIARQYRPQTDAVSYGVFNYVWLAATMGRLHGINEVSSGSTPFLRSAVAAYDIFTLALEQAREGFLTLMHADVTHLEELELACTKADWTDEREFAKLREAIAVARNTPTGDRILIRELDSFRAHARRHSPSFPPLRIGDITKAQARRIAIGAGIKVEHTDASNLAEVRSRLFDMGFGADIEMLSLRAVEAQRFGILPAFWDAMEARADGDEEWDLDLAAHFDDAIFGGGD
jgi:hypothetical protein